MKRETPEMQEWLLWEKILLELKTCGAITETDKHALSGSTNTKGQNLLNLIREWGTARTNLIAKALCRDCFEGVMNAKRT